MNADLKRSKATAKAADRSVRPTHCLYTVFPAGGYGIEWMAEAGGNV